MEAMQDLVISSLIVRQSAASAMLEVEIQEKMIAAMRSGDPCLPFAKNLLCLMQQSAAIAEMNLVFFVSNDRDAALF